MIKIKILNSIYSEIFSGKHIIEHLFKYKDEIWLPGRFKKTRKEFDRSLLFKNKFYTGFITKITDYFKKNNIQIEIINNQHHITKDSEPFLPGIDFRDYQIDAINNIFENQRGVINGGTGIGKTIISIGAISCLKSPKILFLCPSIDILNQAYGNFARFGYSPGILGDKKIEIDNDILVSTVQSFVKLLNKDPDTYCKKFDLVFLDEAHLAMGKNSTCEKIFSRLLSPMKIGLTATIPKIVEKRLLLNGLIGPVIMDLSLRKSIEENILITPKLMLKEVPKNKGLRATSYPKYHELGIVNNNERNNIICNNVDDFIKDRKSVLIFCTKLKHIGNISDILNSRKIPHYCVYGDITGEDRLAIKNKLFNKEVFCVISSVVWVAGLDIPSLDNVILADSGKAENRLLQSIGRVLRKNEDKYVGGIVDYLDPYPYLAEHAIQRITIYSKLGWIK